MIRSMTGYGRGAVQNGDMQLTVEMKSVNHRYLECSVRMPRELLFAEDKLKNLIKTNIQRGKIDVFVTANSSVTSGGAVTVNHSFADSYIAALKELANEYNLKDDISVSTVARCNEVFTVTSQELDEDTVWQLLEQATRGAIENFVDMREAEGKKLAEDVLSRAEKIEQLVGFVEERSPETAREYRVKLEERMRELLDGAAVDEQRLLTETAVMADKLAVAEETVRLRSHIAQLRQLLSGDEAIGRKIDFLVQEMNRETNTIGSKAQDSQIAATVIDMKAEIEKIREQIQNIE